MLCSLNLNLIQLDLAHCVGRETYYQGFKISEVSDLFYICKMLNWGLSIDVFNSIPPLIEWPQKHHLLILILMHNKLFLNYPGYDFHYKQSLHPACLEMFLIDLDKQSLHFC